MKNYEIICREIHEICYTISASSEDEARAKLEEGEGYPHPLNAQHNEILSVEEL
jgi:hypothetical protein